METLQSFSKGFSKLESHRVCGYIESYNYLQKLLLQSMNMLIT